MTLVPRADIHVVRSFPAAFHFGVTGRTPAETFSFEYTSRNYVDCNPFCHRLFYWSEHLMTYCSVLGGSNQSIFNSQMRLCSSGGVSYLPCNYTHAR